MKICRFASLVLALVTVLMLFSSCDFDPRASLSRDNAPDFTGEPAYGESESLTDASGETVLPLIQKGVANYVIVRDYRAGGDVLNAVQSIVNAIKEFTGADIEVKECYNDRDDDNDVEQKHEILVGMTNRKESAEAFKGKRSGDWVLGVYGEKLVVGSPSDAGTMRAAVKFLNEFIYEQGNKYEVKAGNFQSLTFSNKQNCGETGTYSYDLFQMLGARIDSYAIIYAKNAQNAGDCAEFASRLRTYISKETGYELVTKKDTRCYADYEILIGDTIRTDDELASKIGPDDYYIKLNKTEKGAQMIILFGANAMDKAYEAFRKSVMPPSKDPIEKSVASGMLACNNGNLS